MQALAQALLQAIPTTKPAMLEACILIIRVLFEWLAV